MSKKIIYNSKTGRAIELRQRTTSQGRKGQFLRSYETNAVKSIRKHVGRAVKKLDSK